MFRPEIRRDRVGNNSSHQAAMVRRGLVPLVLMKNVNATALAFGTLVIAPALSCECARPTLDNLRADDSEVSQIDDLSRFSTPESIFPLPAAGCAPHLVLSIPRREGL